MAMLGQQQPQGFPMGLPAGFVPSPTMAPAGLEDAGGQQQPVSAAGSARDTPPKPDDKGLPVSLVRRMIKEDPDVKAVSGEAVHAIARAAELFLEELAGRTAGCVPPDSRRGVTYREVSAAVAAYEPCDFLADIVPQKVKAAQLLQQMQQQLQQQTKQANGEAK